MTGTGKENRESNIILAAAAGLAVNILLCGIKFYIGLSANSLSVLTDAVNNAMDTLSFGIVIMGFSLIKKKSTVKMPYGFGRLEYLAGFVMALIVTGTGVYLLFTAFERLLYPFRLIFSWLNFGLIAATVPVKIGLTLFFKHKNKSLKSDVLKASQTDSFLDTGITLVTLIGFSLASYSKLRLDAFIGLIISVVVITQGIILLINNSKTLLGQRIDETDEDNIRKTVSGFSGVEIKSISAHRYGAANVELILELSLTESLDTAALLALIKQIKEQITQNCGFNTKICISE